MQSVSSEFLEQSIYYLELNTPRIEKCLAELSEDEIWQRPNGLSNSVGNLLLHLCGNITQYILSSLGQVPDERVRDAEFAAQGGFNKAELMQKLSETVSNACEVIRNLDQTDLLRLRSVQGFQLSAIGIIIHVTEHYSYHTGQIAFWVKQLKNKDLDFYAGRNLNAKNEF